MYGDIRDERDRRAGRRSLLVAERHRYKAA